MLSQIPVKLKNMFLPYGGPHDLFIIYKTYQCFTGLRNCFFCFMLSWPHDHE